MSEEEIPETLEELRAAIKHSIEENTIVIFQPPRERAKALSKGIENFRELWRRHNIDAIVCDNEIKIIIVPQGSGVQE